VQHTLVIFITTFHPEKHAICIARMFGFVLLLATQWPAFLFFFSPRHVVSGQNHEEPRTWRLAIICSGPTARPLGAAPAHTPDGRFIACNSSSRQSSEFKKKSTKIDN
jgi:hypothetical protein